MVLEFNGFQRYGLATDNLARLCGAGGDWGGVSRLSCEVRFHYPYMSNDDCRLIRNMFSYSLLSLCLSLPSISLSLLPSPSLAFLPLVYRCDCALLPSVRHHQRQRAKHQQGQSQELLRVQYAGAPVGGAVAQ